MNRGLHRRVDALEQTHGDRECLRCSHTLIVVRDAISGALVSASKDGGPITQAEYRRHEAEEEDARCPVCGNKPTVIQIGGSPQSRS